MAFVNQRWFDSPAALLMARGADPKAPIVAPDGTVLSWVTNGGIAAPGRVELAAGTRLVRFGGIGLPAAAIRGSWWLDWSQYRIVEDYADQRGIAVTLAVRRLCCVPLEWSEMEVVVQARLKAPLLAYGGVGAPARSYDARTKTTDVIDPGASGIAIEQLFIPGLGSGDVQHDALMFEGAGHLDKQDSSRGYIVRPG